MRIKQTSTQKQKKTKEEIENFFNSSKKLKEPKNFDSENKLLLFTRKSERLQQRKNSLLSTNIRTNFKSSNNLEDLQLFNNNTNNNDNVIKKLNFKEKVFDITKIPNQRQKNVFLINKIPKPKPVIVKYNFETLKNNEFCLDLEYQFYLSCIQHHAYINYSTNETSLERAHLLDFMMLMSSKFKYRRSTFQLSVIIFDVFTTFKKTIKPNKLLLAAISCLNLAYKFLVKFF